MDEIIKRAIDLTQKEIKKFPNKILSESDFERMLAGNIDSLLKEDNPEGFAVHTQVSYYDEKGEKKTPKYRVDILLMKESEILDCQEHNKGFIYADISYPIEVKYLHAQNSLNGVYTDLEKANFLLNTKGNMYVVVLFDKQNPKKDRCIKNKYDKVLAKLKDSQKRLKYILLYKNEEA